MPAIINLTLKNVKLEREVLIMSRLVKSLVAAFAVFAFMVGFTPANQQAEAAYYNVPSYWNGDLNYPLAFSQGGVNRYVKLSSAKIDQQTKDTTGNTTSTVFRYQVVMVNTDGNTTTFDYKTLVRTGGEDVYVAGWKDPSGWSTLSNLSFYQPQYNAALILADYFGL